MNRTRTISSLLLLTFLSVSAFAIAPASSALAQDKTKETVKEVVAKKRATPRGRLPNHYTKVVTEEQRVEIYSIQKEYADQLKALAEQISKLKAEQTKKIEAILKPEQLAKVKELAKAATEKRATKAKKNSSKTAAN